MPVSSDTMPLSHFKRIGQQGRIVDVHGDDGVAVRLMEMGLTEGEVIQVLGFAPLGDPVEYAIRGYRLTLRSTEAARVQVLPLA